MILTYTILIAIIGAVSDGLRDSRKDGSHLLEIIELGMAMSVSAIFHLDIQGVAVFIGMYLSFRIAVYDIVRALTVGEKWCYLGETKAWDRMLKRLFRKHPVHGVTFARAVFAVLGVFLYLNNLA